MRSKWFPTIAAAALVASFPATPAYSDPFFRMGIDAVKTSVPGDASTDEGPLELVVPPIASREVSQFLSIVPTAKGGAGGYAWEIESPSETAGLATNPSTGAISGTSPWPGDFPFTITVTDSSGATDSETVVAKFLAPAVPPPKADVDDVDEVDTSGDVVKPGDSGTAGEVVSDDDDETYIEVGPGDYIEFDFGTPVSIDEIGGRLLPVCGATASYTLAAYAVDGSGNKARVATLSNSNAACYSIEEPRPAYVPFRFRDRIEWIVPSGWYLRSTCGNLKSDIVSTLWWPQGGTSPNFNFYGTPGDVYAGEHCMGGQAISALDPQHFNGQYAIGFWSKDWCLDGWTSGAGCRYSHVRSYVRFASTIGLSTDIPSWKEVRFSGGTFSRLGVEVVSLSDDTTLRVTGMSVN